MKPILLTSCTISGYLDFHRTALGRPGLAVVATDPVTGTCWFVGAARDLEEALSVWASYTNTLSTSQVTTIGATLPDDASAFDPQPIEITISPCAWTPCDCGRRATLETFTHATAAQDLIDAVGVIPLPNPSHNQDH